MDSKFFKVGDGLEGLLSSPRIAAGLDYGRICNAWPEAAGPAMASAACPQKFEDGHLRISAKNSVWANEIQMRSETIKARLNQALGSPKVAEISVTVARFGERGR
jgi:predicted nucleic acid-binding Zn ribbon protein